MKKFNILLVSIFFVVCLSAQDQDEEFIDLTFKKPNSYGEKKVRLEFSANLNLSTIWGSDAVDYRESLDSLRQLLGANQYGVTLLAAAQLGFSPYLKINEKFSFHFGLTYTHLGWKERLRQRASSSNFRRISVTNNFHYVGIPVGFGFNISEGFRVKFNYNALILASERVNLRDVMVINNQREVTKENFTFEEAYGVELNRFLSTFNLSFQIKLIEFLYLDIGAGVSTQFIRESVDFKIANIQTGLIFKL